jgi:hypothetical protein
MASVHWLFVVLTRWPQTLYDLRVQTSRKSGYTRMTELLAVCACWRETETIAALFPSYEIVDRPEYNSQELV